MKKKNLIKASRTVLEAYVMIKAGKMKKASTLLSEGIEENEDGIDNLMDGIAQSVEELEAPDVDDDDEEMDDVESSEDEEMDDDEDSEEELEVSESVARVLSLAY